MSASRQCCGFTRWGEGSAPPEVGGIGLTQIVKRFTLYHVKSMISAKGQVTVPAKIRERLGLTPGTVVEFEPREGGAFLRKGGAGMHPVDRLFGSLKLPGPVDVLLDEMRGPRPGRVRGRRRPRRSAR